MTLTIDIAPELEFRLREVAATQGVDPREYVVRTLREHLRPEAAHPAALNVAESRLFEELNRGLSEPEWTRYWDLVEQRRAEQLTPEEHRELTALSDRIEQLSVRRLELLLEVARLRGTTLPELMDQLGLQPPPVI
jgi:tRNA nucleotidyltransferase/poly(A) polymerase